MRSSWGQRGVVSTIGIAVDFKYWSNAQVADGSSREGRVPTKSAPLADIWGIRGLERLEI